MNVLVHLRIEIILSLLYEILKILEQISNALPTQVCKIFKIFCKKNFCQIWVNLTTMTYSLTKVNFPNIPIYYDKLSKIISIGYHTRSMSLQDVLICHLEQICTCFTQICFFKSDIKNWKHCLLL